MKKIWFKFRFSIIICGYLSAAVALTYFLIIPLMKDMRTLAYQIQAKVIDREMEKAQINKLPDIKNEWAAYESQEDLLNVILGQQDQVSFIENIEVIAESSGNKIDLKIEDIAKNPSFVVANKEMLKALPSSDYFSIQINLEGDYASLVKFIHLLENSQFYVNIISLSTRKNTIENGGNSDPFNNENAAGDKVGAEEFNDSLKTDIAAIVYTQKQ